MTEFHVGCALITWKNMPNVAPDWDEAALRESGQAGYAGAPTSIHPGQSPADTVARYARYGLKTAPGYFGGTFGSAKSRAEILDDAAHHARFMRAVGCTELYVAAGGGNYVTPRGKTRREIAGQVRPEDALPDDVFADYAGLIDEIGAITLAEGVRSCFHNHVGTIIETREEMDRLLSLTDRSRVFVGPDTGHLAWAGADPVAFCRDYADRIKTVHLKDCHAAVMARGRAAEWDYPAFVQHGIFAELGEGNVDFPAIFDSLRAANFSGWVIAETDRTEKPTARESATVSRDYLRSIGI
ncbi:MAG: sugar phosphate isomerase/epimerase family protein [Thermomicrobiales bacterium]